MGELLAVLTVVALLDSTTMVPLCIVPFVVLLAGERPLLRSAALVAGVFVVYFPSGALILLGMGSLFDAVNAYAVRLWQAPETEELIAQILIGIVLCGLGVRMTLRRQTQTEKPVRSGMTAVQAALAGVGLTLVGLPGAVPYFAAINLILKEDPPAVEGIAALGYYNVVFIAPLLAIVALPWIIGERSQSVLRAMKGFFDQWGSRIIAALLVAFGAVLIADGAGWFLGYPLLPT